MRSEPWRSSRPPGSSGRVRITAFLPAFHFQRFKRSRGLRLFFAATGALAKNNSLPNNLRGKHLFMFRPALRNQFIHRTVRRNALQQFLEVAFRVDVDRLFRQLLEIGLRLRENEFPHRFQIAVQINRADGASNASANVDVRSRPPLASSPRPSKCNVRDRGVAPCIRNASRETSRETQFGQLSSASIRKLLNRYSVITSWRTASPRNSRR